MYMVYKYKYKCKHQLETGFKSIRSQQVKHVWARMHSTPTSRFTSWIDLPPLLSKHFTFLRASIDDVVVIVVVPRSEQKKEMRIKGWMWM